jgi:hypothetical protein
MERGALTGASVFAFGHCNATEEMIDYLSENGVAIKAILDNSGSKQGSVYRDVPIISPAYMKGADIEDSIVLIVTRFFAEMSAQLRRLGYAGEIVKVVDYNSFAEYSLSDETFARKKARMERGAETLAKIRARYPSQHLVICPNNALGDVYWAMAFLPAYLAKHGIREVAVVAIGEGCRQVAEMFGMLNAVTLCHAEMDEFVQALIFARDGNGIIAHHDRPYTDNIIKYLDRHFLSFIDYYRCAVYGLPQDAAPVAPAGLEPYSGAPQLAEGKTVILSPYAKSVAEPPAAYWERLAEQYCRDGYFVCTSVNGDEPAVRQTVPLHIPLSQIISAVECAGLFIGLRNGLCDVLNTANCRKIAVFPDCYYSTTPHKVAEFFALPGWESVVL